MGESSPCLRLLELLPVFQECLWVVTPLLLQLLGESVVAVVWSYDIQEVPCYPRRLSYLVKISMISKPSTLRIVSQLT